MHVQQSGIHHNVLYYSANCFFIVFCSRSCWLTMFWPVSISQCSGKELICWATSSSVSIDVTFRCSGGEMRSFKLIKNHLFFSQVSIFVQCRTLIDMSVSRSVQFLYEKGGVFSDEADCIFVFIYCRLWNSKNCVQNSKHYLFWAIGLNVKKKTTTK